MQADLPLELKARDAGAAARLKDLSTVGLCCTFPEPVPEMTLVRLHLELEARQHAIDGAVVRCEKEKEADRGWEVAVYFTQMEPATQASIEEYVTARTPRQAGAG